MSNVLTEFGNLLMVIGALYSLAAMAIAYRRGHVSRAVLVPVLAMMLSDLAIAYRVGFWAVALSLAPDTGCQPSCTPYNEWFVINKAWAALPAGLIYLWSRLMFVRWIEKHSFRQKLKRFAACVGIAGVLVWI